MECFSPMPQEDYCIKVEVKRPKIFKNISLGLGDPYHVKGSALWNLLALTSRLLYKWEDPKVSKKKKPARFPQLEYAKADLEKEVEGVKVKELMSQGMIGVALLKNNDLSHLSLCKDFHKGDQVALKLIIEARLATLKASRGRKLSKREGTIIAMVSKAK